MSNQIKNILISRTDAIGDVILTLPLVGLLRRRYPNAKIHFFGRSYTQDIIAACTNVDQFHDWSLIEKKSKVEITDYIKELSLDMVIHVFPNKLIAQSCRSAKVPMRIGTRQRFYHLWTCTHRPKVSRKNSPLHEAQLNIQLYTSVFPEHEIEFKELGELYGFKIDPFFPRELNKSDKKSVIFHPGSRGSARDWPVTSFVELAKILPEADFDIFVTGTEKESEAFRDQFLNLNKKNIFDLSGKLSLAELIGFIGQSTSLVAASTGPLHIASACGIQAVGIYPPMRPAHPGRWAPIGKNVHICVKNVPDCHSCKSKNSFCHCVNDILPSEVAEILQS